MIVDAHVALGTEHYLQLDPAALAREMEAHEVSIAVARPLGAELAIYNMRGNDRLLDAGPNVRAADRANPWHGEAALDEIKRCHDRGAVGLYLHPSRQGFMPTDPVAEPLIALAAQLNWPVTFHTGTYIQSDVLAVAELARRFPQTTFVCDSAGFTPTCNGLSCAGFAGGDRESFALRIALIWTEAINKLPHKAAGRIRIDVRQRPTPRFAGSGVEANRAARPLAGRPKRHSCRQRDPGVSS